MGRNHIYTSLRVNVIKLFSFLEGSPIHVTHVNLEPLTVSCFSSTVNFLRFVLRIFSFSNVSTVIFDPNF